MAEHTVGGPKGQPRPDAQAEARPDRATVAEIVICSVLRYGVATSLALIAAGVVLMLAAGGTGYGGPLDPEALLRGDATQAVTWPRTIGGVVSGALAAQPYALILSGLLFLIATPVVRVAISAVAFLAEGDYQYVAITLFVLGVLVLSFFLAAIEGHG